MTIRRVQVGPSIEDESIAASITTGTANAFSIHYLDDQPQATVVTELERARDYLVKRGDFK